MVITSWEEYPPYAALCQAGKAMVYASQFPGHTYTYLPALFYDDLENVWP
jgi:hypothetical protein